MSLETSEGLLEAIGGQALAEGSFLSNEEVSKNIDNVSLTDVANVRRLFVFFLSLLYSHFIEFTAASKTNGVLYILLCQFQAAKKFVSGKKTMASTGNLVKTPFVDEI